MWIMLNDAMFSIVEDKDDKTQLVVRARRKGDIEHVFLVDEREVNESDLSDYRYRIFVDRDRVEEVIAGEIRRIDYGNFKDSVKDKQLHDAYLQVWTAMWRLQEDLHPKTEVWWNHYFEQKDKRTRKNRHYYQNFKG